MIPWYILAGVAALAVAGIVGWILDYRKLARATEYIQLLEMEFRMMAQNHAIFEKVDEAHKETMGAIKDALMSER